FSGGLTGWDNWGNAAVVSGLLQVGTNAGGIGQNLAGKIVAGTKYQLSASASITTTAEGVYVGVKLTDSSGTVVLNQSQLVSSLTATGVSFTFTAPAGAV